MIRLASTLFINEGGSRVGVDRGALMVRSVDGQRTRVPMESIDGVALIGGASITSEAIARCVRAGVRVAAMTRTGRMRFVCSPPTSGNVHLRVAQLRLADDDVSSLEVSRWIIAGKLRNSRRLVQRWKDDAREPERSVLTSATDAIGQCAQRLAGAPTADHLRGIEGEAARWHFKAMGAHVSSLGAPFSMARRSRRPPADPLNAAISFGYGILTAELVGAADLVGIDPQIGFLHGIRSGRPSLALDLLEEFRSQIVDRFVAGALRRRQLRLEHFVETPGGGWYLTGSGRRSYLNLFEQFRASSVDHELLERSVPRWTLPVLQTTILARYLRGDLPAYVPWQGA